MRLDREIYKKLPQRMKEQLQRQYPEQLHFVKSKQQKNSTIKPTAKFCTWPTQNPAHWLHQLLVKEYGDYFNHKGGMVAHEVMVTNSPKKWRYDHCIVPFRLMIEFNGYSNHSLLEAFQRDHEKRAWALTQGFVVYDVSNKMLRTNPDGVREQVASIISHRQKSNSKVTRVGHSFSLIHSDSCKN